MSTRYDGLAGSSDPLLREIGVQLSRGEIRPGGLLDVPDYLRVVHNGLARLSEAAERTRDTGSGQERTMKLMASARDFASHWKRPRTADVTVREPAL
jgi:hypothetical protein